MYTPVALSPLTMYKSLLHFISNFMLLVRKQNQYYSKHLYFLPAWTSKFLRIVDKMVNCIMISDYFINIVQRYSVS